MKKITLIALLVTFFFAACNKEVSEPMPTGEIEYTQKLNFYSEGSDKGYPIDLSVSGENFSYAKWTITAGGEVNTLTGNEVTFDFIRPGSYELDCAITNATHTNYVKKTINVQGQTVRINVMNDDNFANNEYTWTTAELYGSMNDLENDNNKIADAGFLMSEEAYFTNLKENKTYYVKGTYFDDNNNYYENTINLDFTALKNETVSYSIYLE